MRNRKRGFTLLELLVAISLMALLAGSLYGSLFVGFKAHRAATAAVEPARTAALALELLQQDFDAALPPTGVLAGAFTGAAGTATGESGTLSFFSGAHAPNAGETACDIRKVDLSVETLPNESLPVLMRRVTTNLLAANDPVVREQVLCRRIRTFSLRYYDGSVWQDMWDSTGQGNLLPVAVEVTLEFAPDPDREDRAERTYRLVRVFAIPCGRAGGTN